MRWHRDLIHRRHAARSRRKRPGRPPTRRAIQSLVLRLARESPSWGYRRVHGELITLGVTIAASTVWEIFTQHGIEPAPQRGRQTWADFLRSQAHAILACDFFTAATLTGRTYYVFVVIEHASRRIRVLGVTTHPTADWTTQMARNLIMDLQDAGAALKYLIRDRDTKYTCAFDAVLETEGIQIVLTGVRVPRMNSITERWVQTCRHELLDRTLIWNRTHLLHVLREFDNQHRHHHSLNGAPLRPPPEPLTKPSQLDQLDIRRRDRLGGVLHGRYRRRRNTSAQHRRPGQMPWASYSTAQARRHGPASRGG